MKKRWLLLWCIYDPDNYRGHYNRTLEADTLDDAKKQARAILDDIMLRVNLEFRLIEIGDHDSGSRCWDKRVPPNQLEVEYTLENYWNVKTSCDNCGADLQTTWTDINDACCDGEIRRRKEL